MGIYAALSVPEVWRLDGDVLTFQALNIDGVYRSIPTSLAFVQVAPADLLPFIRDARQAANQNEVTRQFREWVRQRRGGG